MPRDTCSNEPYTVYMLRCADGKYYVGVTNDLEHRLFQHNSGINRECFTFKRRPVTLVHASCFGDIWQAIHWEKQLKGWSRAKKEALIKGDYVRIREMASRARTR